jgi:2-amino-4-hydroxy-6-hydroxymethyldihydropteridine diphosphokinase
VQNAPRTLDVDLIVVGDRRADDDHLVLPHPRAAERAFVLAPWHDLESDAEIPGYGAVADLLDKVGRDAVARRDDIELELEVQ